MYDVARQPSTGTIAPERAETHTPRESLLYSARISLCVQWLTGSHGEGNHGEAACGGLLYSSPFHLHCWTLPRRVACHPRLQASDRQTVDVLIRLGVALWQTEDGRAMLHRLLHEFRTTAPCETKLPPVEAEEGQGYEPPTWADRRAAVIPPHSPPSSVLEKVTFERESPLDRREGLVKGVAFD
jgi:hypothetical protein